LVHNNLAQCRLWSAFSKPKSFSDTTLRVRKNYSYFCINYLTIIELVLAFSLSDWVVDCVGLGFGGSLGGGVRSVWVCGYGFGGGGFVGF